MALTVTASATNDFTTASDPYALFGAWYEEAKLSEINDPNAMSLATVDANGAPNVRVVLLKGLDRAEADPRGFVFYTNKTSQKGQELLGAHKAALGFHWKSLQRQVRIRGSVSLVCETEADAYYATRPRGSRIGAWASLQSQPLESRAVLEARIAELERIYPGDSIPRPPHWTGFRVVPTELEFWHDRPFRLHDRVVFRRDVAAGTWVSTRLYP